MAQLDRALIERLRAIVARAPRPYEEPHRRLVEVLNQADAATAAGGSAPERFVADWQQLVEALVLSPSDLAAFFPHLSGEYAELLAMVRALSRPMTDSHDSQALAEVRRGWVADQTAADDPAALVGSLLNELATVGFLEGGFAFLGRYLRFMDALYGHLVDPSWRPLQRRVLDLLDLQRANWTGGYVGDYAYQGYARIGISGVKPTEKRLADWDVAEFFDPHARVLDIGSNLGFLALEVARSAGHVEAIEHNPYLVLIGRAVQDALGAGNVEFVCGDFTDHGFAGGYDVVLSFANHQTTDRHMTMPFADYVAKVHALLRPGGILLFESHNVFGPGEGGPGDDGDLNAKFDVAERFFEVIRHKMTRSFVPEGLDVDKLFVVMRRRDRLDDSAVRTLDLASARLSYDYARP